jgi:heme/copper-type cytochrome/quinol oxidase subunit 4
MHLGTLVKISFIVSIIITLIGACLKLTHSKDAETLLIMGVTASLVFIVSAIIEVLASIRIDNSEKTMWTIAFLFMVGIAGPIYLLAGRNRIANKM